MVQDVAQIWVGPFLRQVGVTEIGAQNLADAMIHGISPLGGVIDFHVILVTKYYQKELARAMAYARGVSGFQGEP